MLKQNISETMQTFKKAFLTVISVADLQSVMLPELFITGGQPNERYSNWAVQTGTVPVLISSEVALSSHKSNISFIYSLMSEHGSAWES